MTECSSNKQSAGCGCGDAVVFDGSSPEYRRALLAVIVLNVLGLVVVAGGSLFAASTALAATSLDFAGDALTYALSLWAIGKAVRIRSGAALFKSASLAVMAVVILGLALWRSFGQHAPDGPAISALGLFGAGVNLVAALLLVRFRDGDANVRSVWLCTRNDLVECVGVAIAGVAVWLTHSRWPDLIVGVFLAGVFLRSAWQIAQQAANELRAGEAVA